MIGLVVCLIMVFHIYDIVVEFDEARSSDDPEGC